MTKYNLNGWWKGAWRICSKIAEKMLDKGGRVQRIEAVHETAVVYAEVHLRKIIILAATSKFRKII